MSKAINATTTSASRSPTRRAVLSVGAAVVAAAAIPQAAGAAPADNPWAPTELGLELMRRLPAWAEATHVRVRVCDVRGYPEYDAEKLAVADEAEDATSALIQEVGQAILDRPVTELAHLTDLAIVTRAFGDEDEDWGSYGGPFDILEGRAAGALIAAVLKLGGVPESMASSHEVYRQVERTHAAA